jgi:two-component system KDP operon response regulator KdpE
MKVLFIREPAVWDPPVERFEAAGLSVSYAPSVKKGLHALPFTNPDLIVIDLDTPASGGVDACVDLRARTKAPIIAVSEKADEMDAVAALEAGVDDYFRKQFGIKELIARMQAVTRRHAGTTIQSDRTFRCDNLSIDFLHRRVSVGDKVIHLRPREYELLCFMVSHADQVLTHKQILAQVWRSEFADDWHTLRVHIASLRNKIETNPAHPRFIVTETRIGYRFQSESSILRCETA